MKKQAHVFERKGKNIFLKMLVEYGNKPLLVRQNDLCARLVE